MVFGRLNRTWLWWKKVWSGSECSLHWKNGEQLFYCIKVCCCRLVLVPAPSLPLSWNSLSLGLWKHNLVDFKLNLARSSISLLHRNTRVVPQSLVWWNCMWFPRKPAWRLMMKPSRIIIAFTSSRANWMVQNRFDLSVYVVVFVRGYLHCVCAFLELSMLCVVWMCVYVCVCVGRMTCCYCRLEEDIVFKKDFRRRDVGGRCSILTRRWSRASYNVTDTGILRNSEFHGSGPIIRRLYCKVTNFRPVPIFVPLTWNWFVRTNFRTFEGHKRK